MNILKLLVVLSIYDGGFVSSLMENGELEYLDTYKKEQQFIKRFAKRPEDISIDELAKHYSREHIVMICENANIQYSEGTKYEPSSQI